MIIFKHEFVGLIFMYTTCIVSEGTRGDIVLYNNFILTEFFLTFSLNEHFQVFVVVSSIKINLYSLSTQTTI